MAVKLNPENIIRTGGTGKQPIKLSPEQVFASTINKTPKVENLIPSPTEVSNQLLKNPSKMFTDQQKTVDALTRIPSANYNGEFAKLYKEAQGYDAYRNNADFESVVSSRLSGVNSIVQKKAIYRKSRK